MSNQFSGVGNLGTDPEVRFVKGERGDIPVAEMRVYFDRPVPNGQGGYENKGGFWLTVSLWGSRAESTARILKKGTRVQVDGILREENCTNPENEQERSALRLTASRIGIDPICIQSIAYRNTKQEVAA